MYLLKAEPKSIFIRQIFFITEKIINRNEKSDKKITES